MSASTARLAALADLLLDAEVLTFGDFTTKSGRATPYFLNFGRVRTGRQISRLAGLYAARIDEVFGTDVDLLFGPAYKGIPLADGDRVVIVEDVTTAGTSIRETVPKLQAVAPAVDVAGLVIAVDRAERAPDSDRAALEVVADDFDMTATAVAHIDELVAFLQAERDVLTDDDVARIAVYRAEWGA